MTCGRAWCVWWYAGWHCAHPPGSQMCGPCCPVASCPPRRLARWSRWACSSRLSFVRFVPLVFAVRARLVARPLAASSASAPRPRFSARAIASGPISIRRASALFPVCLVRSMYASLRGARARPASLYVLGVSLLRFACREALCYSCVQVCPGHSMSGKSTHLTQPGVMPRAASSFACHAAF